MNPWILPQCTCIAGVTYDLNADFRDILQIIGTLQDASLPEFIRWQVALALFYRQTVAPAHLQQAMEYLSWFLCGGCMETDRPGPKLLDWEQDAQAIISDVNKVAAQEIRTLPFLHWWTFLSWFHAIGEGQVSMLVAIRQKLRRGQKLENWEQDYYRKNRSRVDMKKQYTPEELAQRKKLEKLLE